MKLIKSENTYYLDADIKELKQTTMATGMLIKENCNEQNNSFAFVLNNMVHCTFVHFFAILSKEEPLK